MTVSYRELSISNFTLTPNGYAGRAIVSVTPQKSLVAPYDGVEKAARVSGT